jgi:hypothetical protein
MSNLLEKASIITTPTAYSDGVLHSVKPEQTLGSELVVNGDFATDSDWTYGSSWSIGDGKASFDFNIGGASDLRQNSVLTVGKKYKLTFDVLDSNGGNFSYSLGGYAIFINNIEANTTYTVYGKAVGTFLTLRGASNFIGSIDNVSVKEVIDADFTFTRNDAGTRVNASGNIESIGVDLPRIDYRGGIGSLLLEPQATNTATDSNDFTTGDIFLSSNDPSLTSAILTSAQATSPDGTNNAWKLADNNTSTSGATGLKYGGATLVSNNYNTVSLFVKKQGDNDFIYIKSLNYGSTSDGTTYFNISNGTLGTVSSNHTASIDDYGNGWYRCSITFQASTYTVGQFQIYLATSNGNVSITRDGTNGVYIYGLQAESHAIRQYATSYIATSGSPETRAADSATDAGSSDLINSTEGVLYAEIATLSENNETSVKALTLGFDITNKVMIYTNPDSRTIVNIRRSDNALNKSVQVLGSIESTNFNKIAISYKSGQNKIFVNGSRVTDTVFDSFTFDYVGNSKSFNKLEFANGSGVDGLFQGNVKCVAVFKEALTDAELTCLTTI